MGKLVLVDLGHKGAWGWLGAGISAPGLKEERQKRPMR
jgi:hypothetical protein